MCHCGTVVIAPCKEIQIPESRNIFACGIRNLGLWNLESSAKSPESYIRLESGIQLTKGPLQIIISYSLERKTIYGKPPQGIDLNVKA